MKLIEKLIVFLDLAEQKLAVGELVAQGKGIYFKYYPEFIDTGIQISPFKLPLSKEILHSDPTIFEGLFGVFNDSLPDGWGRLLLDRALLKRDVSLNSIGPLDRLAFVGRRGMGALFYEPATELDLRVSDLLNLDEIAVETQKVLAGSSTKILDELFTWGGSSGGARPKIFVNYNLAEDHFLSGTTDISSEYQPWIIKFASSSDQKDIAEIEYAYYKMALDAGLNMTNCKLFEGSSGKKYFGTQRFDRSKGKRIHMHSASGLMHDNFRLSSMDYGHLMDAAFRLEKNVNAYEKILRLAAFNVFAHNRDDHSKNFSFLMDAHGSWTLAPAYDLTFSFSSHGFHSTTVSGEGKFPKKKHLLELAQIFDVKKANDILDQVQEVISNWQYYAKECGVSKVSTKLIEKSLEQLS